MKGNAVILACGLMVAMGCNQTTHHASDTLPQEPMVDALLDKLGRPDRISRNGRTKLSYDMDNGQTVTLIVTGNELDTEVQGTANTLFIEPNLGSPSGTRQSVRTAAAVYDRWGSPDQISGSGRSFVHFDMKNGMTLTFVVSGGLSGDEIFGAYLSKRDTPNHASEAIGASAPQPQR